MKLPSEEKQKDTTENAIVDVGQYVEDNFSDLSEQRMDALVSAIVHTKNESYYAGIKAEKESIKNAVLIIKDLLEYKSI